MAEENGIPGDDVEELIFNGKIKSLVHKQLLEAGKKGGLRGIELVEGVVLAEEEWTPQNVSSTFSFSIFFSFFSFSFFFLDMVVI